MQIISSNKYPTQIIIQQNLKIIKKYLQKKKKYTCEICNRENLDAGNLKLHLFRKHNYSQENYQSYINKII